MSTAPEQEFAPWSRRCLVCGCSDLDPCRLFGLGCCWIVDEDGQRVCSGCASLEQIAASRGGRDWLKALIAYADLGHPPYTPCRRQQLELEECLAGQESPAPPLSPARQEKTLSPRGSAADVSPPAAGQGAVRLSASGEDADDAP